MSHALSKTRKNGLTEVRKVGRATIGSWFLRLNLGSFVVEALEGLHNELVPAALP